MAVTIVGSDIPSGEQIKWYMGGGDAVMMQETLTPSGQIVELTRKAEYGSVITVNSIGQPTNAMLELSTSGGVAADEATGTSFVDIGTTTGAIVALYIDIETTVLKQIMACKDVGSNLSMDTKETEVHGQTQKLQKVGAAQRSATLEELDYDDDLLAALWGDAITDSPAAGMAKWTDNLSGAKKLSALIGKQYKDGVLIKKWYMMGCQVSKIDHTMPTADYYSKSMDMLVDYMVTTTLVPNA